MQKLKQQHARQLNAPQHVDTSSNNQHAHMDKMCMHTSRFRFDNYHFNNKQHTLDFHVLLHGRLFDCTCWVQPSLKLKKKVMDYDRQRAAIIYGLRTQAPTNFVESFSLAASQSPQARRLTTTHSPPLAC